MPKPTEVWGVLPASLTLPALVDPATCPHANAAMGRLDRGTSTQQPWVDVSKAKDPRNGTWTCKDCGQVGHIEARDQGD